MNTALVLFMYANLQHRYQDVLEDCIDLLCEAMAPARTYDNRARSPMLSTASSPSLRSKTPVAVPVTPQGSNMAPGGNVKVVVRVRGFLQRGEIGLQLVDSDTDSGRNRQRRRMPDRDESRHTVYNTPDTAVDRSSEC